MYEQARFDWLPTNRLSAHISRVEKWKYIRASTRCDWLPSIWLSAHIVRAEKSFEIDGEKTASYDSNYFW